MYTVYRLNFNQGKTNSILSLSKQLTELFCGWRIGFHNSGDRRSSLSTLLRYGLQRLPSLAVGLLEFNLQLGRCNAPAALGHVDRFEQVEVKFEQIAVGQTAAYVQRIVDQTDAHIALAQILDHDVDYDVRGVLKPIVQMPGGGEVSCGVRSERESERAKERETRLVSLTVNGNCRPLQRTLRTIPCVFLNHGFEPFKSRLL